MSPGMSAPGPPAVGQAHHVAMRRPARLVAVLLVAALAPGTVTLRANGQTLWPVPGPIIAEFDPPYPDWLPGHRGIDIATAPGQPVRTPREGVIQFAGVVAGTPVVVIGHGVLAATYLPATTALAPGVPVVAGQVFGEVGSSDHCLRTCLHWGARAHGRYVDPRLLLGRYRVVLTSLVD